MLSLPHSMDICAGSSAPCCAWKSKSAGVSLAESEVLFGMWWCHVLNIVSAMFCLEQELPPMTVEEELDSVCSNADSLSMAPCDVGIATSAMPCSTESHCSSTDLAFTDIDTALPEGQIALAVDAILVARTKVGMTWG